MKKASVKKKVLVIGLGMTGLSVVNHLLRKPDSVAVKVMDTRQTPPSAESLPAGVELHAGSWNREWVLAADLIVLSPGIALSTPLLKEAAEKGIGIVGDIELFAQSVSASVPVVGITGSNGKSTVTCLLAEMAKAALIDVGVGGNIGIAALDILADNHALYILELSSFQLETTASLKMSAAVFLNLSEDHMDRYDDMAQYRQAKLKIYAQSALGIWHIDDKQTQPLSNNTPSVSFGFARSDYNLTLWHEKEWLTAKGEPVMPVSDIALLGRHNVTNCLAAMALADAIGISKDAQCGAMRTYQGLPHRCQLALEHKGIFWVNDSKATNLASTLAALDGLQLTGKLHLLVGGEGKGADFSAMKPILESINHTLYCYGRDAHEFASLVAEPVCVETMQEAMDIASRNAKKGDTVLLSPACASFDQFENFMVRGDTFIAYAKDLATKVT